MLLMLPLVAVAQPQPKVLLLSEVSGPNSYTHSNIPSIKSAVEGYLTANGICQNDIYTAGNKLSNADYPDYELSGSNWCLVVNISSSGAGFANSLAEKTWWLNLPVNTRIINIHPSCGDANRHSSVPGAPASDNFFAEMFSLASLPSTNKHSWSNNQDDAFLTPTGLLRFPNMSPVWIDVTDEIYWLSDQHSADNNSYWNNTNVGVAGWHVLARADENGPFPNGHQVPVIWEVYNNLSHHIINISYGHGHHIHTAGQPQYEMLTGILQYALDKYLSFQGPCSCLGTAFDIKEDTLLKEPAFYEPDRMYKWYAIDGRYLGEAKYPPISNTLLIRKAYGIKPRLILSIR